MITNYINTKLFLLLFTTSTLFIIALCEVMFDNSKQIEVDSSLFKNGDLLLRRGKSVESFAVYTADSETEFSHIGMVIIEAKKVFVIHALPHKKHVLIKETLAEFLSKQNASKFAIYRSNFSENELLEVTNNITKFYTSKIVFDNQYNLSTNDKMYCTELIFKAYTYANINLEIKPTEFNYIFGKKHIILPSAFTKYPFEKVIY